MAGRPQGQSSLGRARALEVLGLRDPFTSEQLLREYHRRLFAVHPDTATEELPDAARLVHALREAREVLEAMPDGARAESESVPGGEAKPERTTDSGGRDGYHWYREGSSLVGDALDDYFRERLHYSQALDTSPGSVRLRETLLRARALFARVLETHPGGLWTPDAVEQIARINVWLGRKQGSFARGPVEETV